MSAVATVFRKEVLENIRDHRVILSAFFFGVLLAPIIFALTANITSKRVAQTQEEPLEISVSGADRAPNLLAFFEENGAIAKRVELSADEAMRAVRSGAEELVLIVPEDYPSRLRAGEPAPIELVVDTANTHTSGNAERARRLLEGYSRQLAALRLLVRGIDPDVIRPIAVQTLDVATPAGRAALFLGMLTYFCFMSMLVGGFYLAIDTTAGERERGSLEPLLSLPVSRASLIVGKMLATSSFMAVSLLLTLVTFGIVLRFIPLERFGMSANFGWEVVAGIFAVMVAFVPLGAALMTVVASFTRSNREAQSWLSVVLFVPLAPILYAQLSGTKASAALMFVPSLSQHLLGTNLLRGDSIPPLHFVISAGTTLALGVLLALLAVRLYEREAILG
ncbi:MAG: ABC transporter permease [Xanthomonadaceae bacterium]|nr:ABC transporter permease [Xanthomonadaceae bacterium]